MKILEGDCRETLRTLSDNSIDSCLTDPPYALVSVVKRFGSPTAAPAKGNEAYMRASAGFMGKTWDNGETAFDPTFWSEVFRVLKPGAYLAAFGATRGYHRMACAIEDAGFEIRDSLAWMYGTGFPKSHDVSKGIDKQDAIAPRLARQFKFTAWVRSTGITAAQIDAITGTCMGSHYTTHTTQPAVATRELFEKLRPFFNCVAPAEIEQLVDERTVESENMKRREIVGQRTTGLGTGGGSVAVIGDSDNRDVTVAHTPEAQEWQGWGTALKPAFEPIVLARKPLSESTVAANVLRWRTGALNIDATRIPGAKPDTVRGAGGQNGRYGPLGAQGAIIDDGRGRWPANVVHDGSDEVVAAFPHTKSGAWDGTRPGDKTNSIYGKFGAVAEAPRQSSEGSAARFFYSAKASKADRNGSRHPTVKPITLIQWLARLITPPGGSVLDPFAGSGTTGAACALEGFNCVMCEREAEYVADIRRRFAPAFPWTPKMPWEI